MSSHHTYIPWFKDRKDPNDGEKEIQEEKKTLRLCVNCNKFREFRCNEKTDLWLFFCCVICGETINLPRERNRAARKWDKKKWM